jgi:hypothetical protein
MPSIGGSAGGSPSGDSGSGSDADFAGITADIERGGFEPMGIDFDAITTQGLQDHFGNQPQGNTPIDEGMMSKVVSVIIGIIAAVVSGGNIGIGMTAAALVQRTGLSKTAAESIAANINSGQLTAENASEVVGSLTTADFEGPGTEMDVTQGGRVPVGNDVSGQGTPAAAPFDPNSYDFWKDFVTEWQSAKSMFAQDDAFKKEKAGDALGTYQKRLQGITGEAGHQPITWGMGDFSSTFMPRSGRNTAKELLTSELAKTDIMQPNKGQMDYLAALRDIAQNERTADNAIALKGATSGKTEQQDDQGTWLDAMGDILSVADSGTDLWDWWGK